MFRKIAEWLTGKKRDDQKHPLDYIDRKAEQMHAPYKVEPVLQSAPLPAPPAAQPLEAKAAWPVPPAESNVTPVTEPKNEQAKASPVANTFAEGDADKPWPFPTSRPEPTNNKSEVPAEETKTTKTKKTRAKRKKAS